MPCYYFCMLRIKSCFVSGMSYPAFNLSTYSSKIENIFRKFVISDQYYLILVMTYTRFTKVLLIFFSPLLLTFNCFAQQQDQEPPTVPEMAATEAERLERLLSLEYWQVFYVDSTLQHDFQALKDEMDGLQKSKVSNVSMYVAVQDKWMDRIDSTYMKIFTDEQWKAYLKNGAAKMQKARAKRKAKAEGQIKK